MITQPRPALQRRPASGRPSRSSARTTTTCAIKARWCLDIKYGLKLDAASLLQEWVDQIGSTAGLTAANTAILSGAVGVPESRLELEVGFETLAELEQFWARIPPAQHKAWSQRLQAVVVHGSPTWEVYRTVEVFASASPPAEAAQSGAGLVMPTSAELGRFAPAAASPVPSTQHTTASGLSVVQGAEEAARVMGQQPAGQASPQPAAAASDDEDDVILDWKGDPMTINPGDRMPSFGVRRRRSPG